MNIDNEDMRARRGAAGGIAVPAQKRPYSVDRDLAVRSARKGGAAVPAEKRSFSTNRALARAAGSLGGSHVPAEKRTFSLNREAAVRAARRGVELRRKRVQTKKQEDAGSHGKPAPVSVTPEA